MRKRSYRATVVLLIAALTLVPLPGFAREISLDAPISETTPPPSSVQRTPALSAAPLEEHPPLTLNCASALLVEPESGQILFEQNADTPRAVASVTKVMTILLTLEAVAQGRVSLEESVTVSERASGMGGSQVLLDTGEVQTVSVLLKSCIVGSANDAAVALAEHLYGSEELFVRRMNERAKELGLENTVFVNCTGLPAEGQHTTARDVARMSMEMFSHELYFDFSRVWLDEVDHFDGRATQLTNTNRLIRLYEDCDGGKTGSTNEAGYCISATARRGDMRLIAIVLGADSGSERFEIAAEMFDYGFANYRLYPVAKRGTKIRGELPVNGGDASGVPLVLDGALTLLVLKGRENEISLVPNLPETLEAPVEAGAQVGTVDVVRDGRVIAQLPVITAGNVENKGFSHTLKKVLRAWKL